MSQSETYEPSTLRIEPHMLPMLRTAFEGAIGRLHQHVEAMNGNAHLHDAWLGDTDSQGLFEHYRDWVMGGYGGPFSAVQAYEQRLRDIHQQLQAAENAYRQAEGDNADLWGRA